MGSLFNLIRTAFEWALFFAMIGGLGEATTAMYKEAAGARAHGLISLVGLNRALVGDAGLTGSQSKQKRSGRLSTTTR